MPQDGVRRNELIRAREVRVIGADGEQLGILQRNEAIALAKEGGMDLADVAKVDQEPRAEGRTLQMLLVPKK